MNAKAKTIVSSAAAAALAAMPSAGAGKAAPEPRNVPALMRTFAGEPVETAGDWEKKRAPELLERFQTEIYGRRPVAADERARVSFTVLSEDEAMEGTAIRKIVRAEYAGPLRNYSFAFTVFIPKSGRPCPAFLFMCNRVRSNIDPDRTIKSSFWPAEEIVARGYATATFFFGDVAADENIGFSQGIFPAVEPEGARTGESWGTLSAWAWAASRVLDWMETEPSIDVAHVAAVGHSRGGKTALLAAVLDKRFAMACSNDSGCCGAKLNHIKLPKSENFAAIQRNFPYWFCKNFARYRNKETEMDFDQHEFIALIAPRLVAVASATEDHWAGQRGEWWSAKLASPAWELYGKKGLAADAFPSPEKPQQEGCISYHLRTGHHNLTPYDWHRYMDFADRHGWRKTK